MSAHYSGIVVDYARFQDVEGTAPSKVHGKDMDSPVLSIICLTNERQG